MKFYFTNSAYDGVFVDFSGYKGKINKEGIVSKLKQPNYRIISLPLIHKAIKED